MKFETERIQDSKELGDAKKIHYLVWGGGKTLGTRGPHTWGRKMGNSPLSLLGHTPIF